MDNRRPNIPSTGSINGRELLGWDDAHSGAMGFHRAKASEPITYSGPGHRMTLGMTGSGKAVNQPNKTVGR